MSTRTRIPGIESEKLVYEEVVPPKRGFTRIVKKGQYLRIVDVMGKQVGDLVVFNEHNLKEKLSNGVTKTRQWRPGVSYQPVSRITTGNVLYSTGYRAMMTITADTPVPGGIHDLYYHMCNREMYQRRSLEVQDGCWEILSGVLNKFGISPEEIPDAFCVFMNAEPDATGVWHVKEPVSRPGDFIEFRAEMDCIVGLSNCPAESICNGWKCTPLKVEIYE